MGLEYSDEGQRGPVFGRLGRPLAGTFLPRSGKSFKRERAYRESRRILPSSLRCPAAVTLGMRDSVGHKTHSDAGTPMEGELRSGGGNNLLQSERKDLA